MGIAGTNALVQPRVEDVGANCATGGIRLESGLDANADGTLQSSEVTNTQFVCHGTGGSAGQSTDGLSSLVRTRVEAAGSHCATGGVYIEAGLDANGDGVLGDDEVNSGAYVCNGPAGAPGAAGPQGATGASGPAGNPGGAGATGASGDNNLMAMAVEAAGVNCPHGGLRVTSGLDTNHNGTLDTAEVTLTQYVCRGAPGTTGAAGDDGAPGATGPQGTSMLWETVTQTASPTQATPNRGYVADASTQVTITLPTSPAVGDLIQVTGAGTGGWRLRTNANQFITTRSLPATYTNFGNVFLQQEEVRAWKGVAMSANGVRRVAITDTEVYRSEDSGQTWRLVDMAPDMRSVAMSADGRYLATASGLFGLRRSNSFGDHWVQAMSNWSFSSVVMSANGRVQMVMPQTANDTILLSTDYGASWVPNGTDTVGNSVAAISGDGSIIFRTRSGAQERSTDSGATWNPPASPLTSLPGSIAMSYDGQSLQAMRGSSMHYSLNGGNTWASVGTVPSGTGGMVVLSADGQKAMLALRLQSPNGGLWMSLTSPMGSGNWKNYAAGQIFSGLAMSADGTQALTATDGGRLQSIANVQSTPGSGALAGSQYDSVTLQYLGNNEFAPLNFNSYSGRFTVY